MKYKIIFILLILSLIPLADLFNQGLPLTHDGQDHVARIANFYQNLQEGNLVPRWAGNLNWGYGHPILMFLYPLPSYFTSFFHIAGFSFVDSLKIVFAVSYVLSGLAMFIFIKELLGKEEGFLAAILYMFAPYRFVDLYVRGAVGEHVAFIFPPLICYFILRLQKEKAYSLVGLTFSIAGLILSHNAISLMFMPLIFLFALYIAISSKNYKKFILHFLASLIWAFSLASFFWIPAFFEGKYTLRDKVSAGEYLSRFVDFKNLLYGSWSYGGTGQFTTQVGFLHWFFITIGITFTFIKSKKTTRCFLMGIITLFVITLFLMTSFAIPIWKIITILQKFQFPWRLLSVTVFLTSIAGAYFISVIKNKKGVVLIFVVALLFLNKDYWHAKGYVSKSESFYKGIYFGTTDTGESAPIWSIRFMEHVANSNMEIILGNGNIENISRKITAHKYKVNAQTKVRLRENTLYFPGWDVYVDKKQVSVEFQDQQNRGLITFFAEKGSHTIDVVFKETKLRYFADILSIVAVVVMILYIVSNNLWKRFL